MIRKLEQKDKENWAKLYYYLIKNLSPLFTGKQLIKRIN